MDGLDNEIRFVNDRLSGAGAASHGNNRKMFYINNNNTGASSAQGSAQAWLPCAPHCQVCMAFQSRAVKRRASAKNYLVQAMPKSGKVMDYKPSLQTSTRSYHQSPGTYQAKSPFYFPSNSSQQCTHSSQAAAYNADIAPVHGRVTHAEGCTAAGRWYGDSKLTEQDMDSLCLSQPEFRQKLSVSAPVSPENSYVCEVLNPLSSCHVQQSPESSCHSHTQTQQENQHDDQLHETNHHVQDNLCHIRQNQPTACQT